ncbi:hypothetical protein GCM10017778_55390 [Streptomyces vinaceus]|nr:hypothetical protein GCM10017778_55390 [Streptomyces vinaceus]
MTGSAAGGKRHAPNPSRPYPSRPDPFRPVRYDSPHTASQEEAASHG